MGAAVMQVVSKQQLRTQETQARLLNAAEEVFVRDGYEAAQLDEIAARADRSKGAVYNHFKSKEDLFLALFEHRMTEYIARLTNSLQKATSRKQSLDIFRDFYVGVLHDRTWPILMLEFKLYALRHPESKERLRKSFEISKATTENRGYEQMFGQLKRARKEDNDLALAALGPIVNGLVLESHFETEILSEKGLRRILGKIFDALFPARR
jgi:AcrR family transcriptional regulator